MEYIDFNNWARKEHFEFFKGANNPQFNICMNLDITHFLKFVKDNDLSFYFSMVYASTYVMNEMQDFRYKIRKDGIVLHDYLIPSFTDMSNRDNLYKIITLPLSDDIKSFSTIAKKTSKSQQKFFPKIDFHQDKLIYFSCIPWISFTSVSNEMVMDENDSIPRISFGKYFTKGNKVLLPYSIQVNHKLLDGYHVGYFIEKLQEYINKIKRVD
ncbi:chloramphenicol acetyltransferase [Clostridium tetani]|uniref:chloramphenicol acetyltransferase n=1 Tax=Clostridium tetani TaxID=1513 RepID=UPI00100B1CD0|nr:chloramphenicol acetyltransferase [Clostridium tetani]RXM58803.1 chloramphenicol acetyltransferase [Clostridium tetani]